MHCDVGDITGGGSAAVQVRPVISSITPSRGPVGNTVNVLIPGSGFGIFPTVNAGDGISVSVNIATPTFFQINATFAIASTASGGNHPVTVTVSGLTSKTPANFFVQIPTSLTVLLAGPALPLPNGCDQTPPAEIGTQLRVSYQVNDQNGAPLSMSFTGVREDKFNLTILGQQNQTLISLMLQ